MMITERGGLLFTTGAESFGPDDFRINGKRKGDSGKNHFANGESKLTFIWSI